MGKSLIKDLMREIKKSFGRFIAIFAIVAIGVAFFAGVTAASSDMRYSADSYYDDYNLMDIRLLSSIGFDESDISAIQDINGINGVFATHLLDVLVKIGSNESATKVMTVPIGECNSDNENYINQLRIKEGRLPEKSGECVVKYETVQGDEISIGDKIRLKTGTDEDINGILTTSEYEVVGIVSTPYYLSYEMGTTAIGNGKISRCIIIPESDFKSELYTEVFATVDGAKAVNSYDTSYFKIIDKVTQSLNELGTKRIEKRLLDIKTTIKESVSSQLKFAYGENLSDEILQQAIEKGQQDALQGSSDWKWFVLDRNSHYSYRDYGQCADQMDSIAAVFPIFFIFVAALVCLTTMTRMVDEHRGMIGTFKALGYNKAAIAFKYICYALMASLFGGILGCVIGLNIFPRVIYTSWNIMYEMPPIHFAPHQDLIFIAIASMATITTLAALMACIKDLLEAPALLMRPKSPKKGKKILLERIGFVWKRMKFTQKVAARNIFRYKKRFIMTIIGISGCTALLMAGFGIKDSISGLLDNQFNEIFNYDATISFSDKSTQTQREQIISDIKNDSRFTGVTLVNSSLVNANAVEMADADHEDISVNFIIASDSKQLADFITFRSRSGNHSYSLQDDGVIISEKLAADLNVKAGDRIYIENESKVRKQVTISSVTEMYISHYVYSSDEYYEQIFGEKIMTNEALVILNNPDATLENEVGSEFLEKDGIESITFFTSSIAKFDDTIQSLDLVTYVLIVSAALLAFVVLYNLTNVNISERLREIATIKVLGFYDSEVAAYVYRENIVMTIFGSILGMGLGVILHRFIMKTVEMEGVMFGYQIQPLSFVLSFVMTMVFSLLVNFAMKKKLKNIQMVESLKSVE